MKCVSMDSGFRDSLKYEARLLVDLPHLVQFPLHTFELKKMPENELVGTDGALAQNQAGRPADLHAHLYMAIAFEHCADCLMIGIWKAHEGVHSTPI